MFKGGGLNPSTPDSTHRNDKIENDSDYEKLSTSKY